MRFRVLDPGNEAMWLMVWCPCRGTLEFNKCQDLKNPWNDSKPVKISRDGQVGGEREGGDTP